MGTAFPRVPAPLHHWSQAYNKRSKQQITLSISDRNESMKQYISEILLDSHTVSVRALLNGRGVYHK